MVKVNKGYLQVNGNYIRISKDQVDQEFCEKFEASISESPQDIIKKLTDNPIFNNPVAGKILENAQEGSASEEVKKDDL